MTISTGSLVQANDVNSLVRNKLNELINQFGSTGIDSNRHWAGVNAINTAYNNYSKASVGSVCNANQIYEFIRGCLYECCRATYFTYHTYHTHWTNIQGYRGYDTYHYYGMTYSVGNNGSSLNNQANSLRSNYGPSQGQLIHPNIQQLAQQLRDYVPRIRQDINLGFTNTCYNSCHNNCHGSSRSRR